MIEFYVGTKRGRDKAYRQFIVEMCMDTGM